MTDELTKDEDRNAMGWVRYVDHCEAVQQVAAQRDEAFRLLGISAERFRFYESQHRNNGTPHGDRMAEINAEQAAEIETFLAKTQGGGADE